MTRLETHAWWNFNHFYSSMFEIWKTYKRYGESVLEADLEEGDEKFKPLFTNSKKDDHLFKENVKKYWQQNYHFVAGDYEELFKIFSDYRQRENAENSLSLLPERGIYLDRETKGYEQTYSVKKGFYDDIIVKMKASNLRDLILINYKEEKVYILHLSKEQKEKGTYAPIIISECKKSEIVII